jgi:hypothetical protein
MLTLFVFFFSSIAVTAQTTTFTYQGKLTDAISAANGTYDLQFALYDALTGGNQVGTTQTQTGVMVNRGVFTVDLDFGSQFPGADRWLEISVKKPSDSSYTTLLPRQKISSVPYAVRALSAATADSLSSACVDCVADSQINSVSGSKVTGTVANATNAATATSATTATTATTANAVSPSAGDSVVTAINAGSSTINAARLPPTLATQNGTNTFSGSNTFSFGLSAGSQRVTNVATPTASTDAANKAYVDSAVGSASFVQFAPPSQQTATTTNALINLKLIGAASLGKPAETPLMSLSASGTYNGQTYDKERFRVNNDGGILAVGEIVPLGVNGVPAEGAGTRFMWYPGKAAIRAGSVDGTQWDDANIGYYSTAFGYNARALGDWAVALGRNSAAPQSHAFALGHYTTASGYASVAMGEAAHTNARQGSFVFADRSYTTICDTTMVEGSEYRPSGCTDTRVLSPWNNAFTVRASGGTHLYTNATRTTGLRLSGPSVTGNGAGASDVLRHGSFVWTDRSSDTAVDPTAQNQTIFRSSGGFTVYTNSGLTSGVYVSGGSGTWNSVSDRNMKENFKAVNSRDILRKVLNLPITTWNYKTQDASVRHIGAMAQDFKAAFRVGEDDKHISTIDPDGVAFAAIQGLNEELKDELKTRDAKIERLETQLKQQQGVIEGMKKLLCANNPTADVCK